MTGPPSSTPGASRPFRRWAFFAMAVAVGLGCIRLGIWQLDRLAERRAANAAVMERLELPEISLAGDSISEPGFEYRRASARGRFDAAHEVVLTNRSQEGIAGVHVVTPLLLAADGPAVLVDRGWISEADYRSLPPESWAVAGSVEVSGILLPSQQEPSIGILADRIPAGGEPALREWRALFIEGMRRQIPYPILDVYLAQQSAAPGPTAPQPSAELDLSEGPHLGYAVQWFAFALIAFVGGFIWLRRGPGRAAV